MLLDSTVHQLKSRAHLTHAANDCQPLISEFARSPRSAWFASNVSPRGETTYVPDLVLLPEYGGCGAPVDAVVHSLRRATDTGGQVSYAAEARAGGPPNQL